MTDEAPDSINQILSAAAERASSASAFAYHKLYEKPYDAENRELDAYRDANEFYEELEGTMRGIKTVLEEFEKRHGRATDSIRELALDCLNQLDADCSEAD